MSKLDSSKLNVTFFPPATPYKPFENRKYTVEICNETGKIYVTIGNRYFQQHASNISAKEITAQWTPRMGQFILNGKVHVSKGEFDEEQAKIRLSSFQQHLDLALAAIVFGDQKFFHNYPWLLDSPIYIHFESNYPQFHQMLYFGTPRQFLNKTFEDSLS